MQPSSTAIVEQIVRLLVSGDYAAVERLTSGRNLTAAELEQAVHDYGRRLVLPAADEFHVDAIQVTGRVPVTWYVRVDLWTAEEGKSDLSLELSVVEHPQGPLAEMDGLHVL
ncbi:MAG TPA: hypothetical protein VI072_24170 [Polyangiaceae bacterium]